MLIHIVKSPTEFTLELLARRGIRFDKNRPVKLDAVGLVQGKLAEMIVAADIATKSADVRVEEIKGVCPQHFMLIAIFGDTASVETALKTSGTDSQQMISSDIPETKNLLRIRQICDK